MDSLTSQINTIKGYAKLINSDIEDGDLLDFVVASVVERALVYMNRLQLTSQEVLDFYSDRDEVAPQALPTELERVLGTVVVGAYRNMQTLPTQGKEITSISDNGQQIQYSDMAADFLARSDADIFSGSIALLNKFRLAKVLEPTNRLSQFNTEGFLRQIHSVARYSDQY